MPYLHIGYTRRTRSRIYLSPSMQQLLNQIQTAGHLGVIFSWSFEYGKLAPYQWPRRTNGAFVASSGLKSYWANSGLLPPLCLHGSKVGNELSVLEARCTIRPGEVGKYRLACPFEGTDDFCGYVVLIPSRPLQSGVASAGMGTHVYIHDDGQGFLDNLRLARRTFSTLSDEDIFPGLQFDLNLSGVPAQLLPPAGLPAAAAPPPAGLPTAAAPPPALAPQPLAAPFPPFPILPPPAGLEVFSEEIGPALPSPLPFIERTAGYRALICLATTTGLAPDHVDALFDSMEKCRYCWRTFLGPAFEAHQGTDGIHGCERTGGSGFGNGLGRYKGLDAWSAWSTSASRSYKRRMKLPIYPQEPPPVAPIASGSASSSQTTEVDIDSDAIEVD
ncbi:hypothetical protein K439DRAFT_1665601 [Ramaria rubella]|nr:hypothetical protein K439DRAFT_1665601 [Ramaria rubella]